MTISIKDLEALKQGHDRVSTAADALIAALASVTGTPALTVDAPAAPFQVGDLVEYTPGVSKNLGMEGIQRIVSRVKNGGGLELADPVAPEIAVNGNFYEGIAPYRVRKVEALTLWGYKVGDLVKYTERGVGQTGDVRKVVEVTLGDEPHLSLSRIGERLVVGWARAADQITRA